MAIDRFWPKVDQSAGLFSCWPWLAQIGQDGYGRVKRAGRDLRAHRVAYEDLVGPIPAGLTIDHLCRNRACVNPAHLEPVTQRENIRRGLSGQHERAKTHCPQGHPYDEANTRHYVTPDGRRARICRACHRVVEARRRTAA